MAPLSLACPLCCKETFSSHISLKYHLLSMIDNLLCPSCNERCDDLMDMADHLGRDCKNLKTPSTNEQPEITASFKESSRLKDPDSPNIDFEINEESKKSNVKVEAQEDPLENSETGNKILDIDDSGNVNESQMAKNGEEVQVLYTCQMCNVSFESVQDHLAKFHEGEEVLLETEQDDVETPNESEAVLEYQEDSENDADDLFDEESNITENPESGEDAPERKKSSVETISEENRVDKDGMNYTRKVVRLGPEWMEDNKSTVEPNTTKYIVEEGSVRQLSEEEANEITDKSSIIEVHSCPKCNLQFPSMTHFKKHNCNNAKNAVSKKKERKNQLVKIKEELRYQCIFCLAVYSSLTALNDHMKAHLIQDETGLIQKKVITMTLHKCDVCNTKFPTYKQLRLHSRMHGSVKDREVDPPVSYNIMGQNNEENEEPNNTERETFQCPFCKKTYDKEYEEVHLKSHENHENIVCLVCNRKFDTKENLEMHMKAHSNTKKFTCSYCKKPFNNYSALEEHVLNQCQKRQYECQYCGRRFARPHEKVKHERIHTGEKPHVCQLCGRAFRVSYCLTLHMRTHTNTRPYTCEHCGKRFKSHSVYNHHMQTHSDERNYKCTFCPKAFKTAVQLAGHKNSHIKPFSCNECNRPFASLYAVRAHMETHKRDNNLKFECWICGASYARSFALKDHMKTIHGQGPNQEKGILLELEETTGEVPIEPMDGQDVNEEIHQEDVENQMNESEEYQVTGNEDEVCQVMGQSESVGDGYEVHLQEVESSENMEESPME